ncbi:hypothetical protein NC653_040509 [Populus alba x Populus x berolinensis]|uniref:Uncharacterized protein n=1 Tax=Populus alba x Populus x berolinensis TaxID=444605 RepID=A0AAD6L6Q5_9ROSI|nr:hypothetical protein NC653_040509 [Populus alba x Populus x berolinensis]
MRPWNFPRQSISCGQTNNKSVEVMGPESTAQKQNGSASYSVPDEKQCQSPL